MPKLRHFFGVPFHQPDGRRNPAYADAMRRRALQLVCKVPFDIEPSCFACGISDWRVLEIDHVYSNGASMRKIEGVGSSLAGRILSGAVGTDHLQSLCANCHRLKRIQEHEDGKLETRKKA